MQDQNMSATEALAMLGFSIDEVEAADETAREKGPRDRRVCACGHAVARHAETYGAIYCKPSRMECPCKKVRPVLETGDTRAFLRKTDGLGSQHALVRGIVAAQKRNKSVKWIIELKCDRCGAAAEKLIPTPVTQRGIATTHPTGFDALLCPACIVEV